MTTKQIIESEADRKSRKYQRGGRRRDAHIKFKDELNLELYNYDAPLDKLIYLYRVNYNFKNYYSNHLENCEHKENPENCGTNTFFIKSNFFLEQEIKRLNPQFDFKIIRPQIDNVLATSNLQKLKKHPSSAELYLNALDNLNKGLSTRNVLDDMRLCLELLLKDKLQNNKPIEKQLEYLGKHLKEKGINKEVINIFRIIIDSYSKYQNNNIKHNDKAKDSEIDFIINLTSSMIKFLIYEKK